MSNNKNESIIDIINNTEKLIANGKIHKGTIRFGCKFDDCQIKEFENDLIYIPSSKYCFIKCLEKLYDIKISRKNLYAYGDSLLKLRDVLPKKYVMPDVIKIKIKKQKKYNSSEESSEEVSSEDSSNDNSDEEYKLSYSFEPHKKVPFKKIDHFILMIEILPGKFHSVLVNENKIKEFKGKITRSDSGYLRAYQDIKKNITFIDDEPEDSPVSPKNIKTTSKEVLKSIPEDTLELDIFDNKTYISYLLSVDACQIYRCEKKQDEKENMIVKYYSIETDKEVTLESMGETIVLLSLTQKGNDNENAILTLPKLKKLCTDIKKYV